ncbi:hypothetical protein KEC56_10165 [Microbacterium sp. YMB-B2]|uniref:Uncharacterized protein n=1 Tax=Microbacterium tenebrionis TaxID=2830665 RepID=A0A9X1LQ83_9MICO|nr:hypothetical protein [Microbacterium tenebrionis]MCC2029875.1 hypothetical protein [Microbacterium tenebrionis]
MRPNGQPPSIGRPAGADGAPKTPLKYDVVIGIAAALVIGLVIDRVTAFRRRGRTRAAEDATPHDESEVAGHASARVAG